MKKFIPVIKLIVSYISAGVSGMYGLCLVDGEHNMFTILGFCMCVLLTLLCIVDNFKKE